MLPSTRRTSLSDLSVSAPSPRNCIFALPSSCIRHLAARIYLFTGSERTAECAPAKRERERERDWRENSRRRRERERDSERCMATVAATAADALEARSLPLLLLWQLTATAATAAATATVSRMRLLLLPAYLLLFPSLLALCSLLLFPLFCPLVSCPCCAMLHRLHSLPSHPRSGQKQDGKERE